METPQVSRKRAFGAPTIARIGLGALLLLTGIAKLADIRGFAGIVADYSLLPDVLLLPVALAIGLAELGLAFWLLSGRRVAAAAAVTLVMHLAYFLLLATTLLRGITLSNCGCFGVFWPRPLGLSSLAEDLVLAAIAFLLWRSAARRAAVTR
ncbi:MAG TPA: MauE/DoxX family redox-associated membrane protein [Allosphingosinicella sp.]|nr:MauE/DoxX family redox-associated membrane protein [Allosphingosinicella sp.]